MIINKDKYLNDAASILKHKNVDKDDLDNLLKLATGIKCPGVDSDMLVEGLISKIFHSDYFTTQLIDWRFLKNNEVGRAIIKVKFDLNADVYLVSDLIKITGFSRSNIIKDANNGNLIGEKREGTWIFSQHNVDEYFAKKGINVEAGANFYAVQEEKIGIDNLERESSYGND